MELEPAAAFPSLVSAAVSEGRGAEPGSTGAGDEGRSLQKSRIVAGQGLKL